MASATSVSRSPPPVTNTVVMARDPRRAGGPPAEMIDRVACAGSLSSVEVDDPRRGLEDLLAELGGREPLDRLAVAQQRRPCREDRPERRDQALATVGLRALGPPRCGELGEVDPAQR